MTTPHTRWMTYNIRLGLQQGLGAIATIILDSGADVIALQEVGKGWTMGPPGDSIATLSALTGLPYALHVPALQTPPAHHYGHALLSRWPIQTRADAIELLPKQDDEQRALLTSCIHTPQGPVHLISTHLSWIGDRPAQGDLLVTRAKALAQLHPGGPTLVLGDLNEHDPSTPWLAELLAWGQDADGQRQRLTFPAQAPTRRIDYLIAHGGRWEQVAVIEDAQASDHFPVVADLVWPLPPP